ncbi:Glycine/D-amino acid oxidase [Paraburkholderia fungorum]|uniref:Glycine/D-amino acid oxidase n=1 Tax=Paraburkholderia fungorum TaxID=134537 RepID=A0A1H1JFS0_9BURK|nr:FAD-binding oxidoreductase [Paraburkholderia fungorum]SDR48765.1 Glycine/D-amino acid oxidase [Paraburkholderia fungorum]
MAPQAHRHALRQNYWPTAAGAAIAFPRLDADIDCDVVVIGAGIMGLNAALELAGRGVSVAVVEAEHPAAAASGRNGGLVVPSLPRVGPLDVVRLLGDRYGPELVRLVADGAQTVFSTIERHQLKCDAVQGGWINPAHAGELVEGLQARVSAWQRAGSRATWLNAAEARQRIGSDTFHGALYDPSGGHLNPFGYTQELARVASEKGARIFCESPVLRVGSGGGRYVVHTPTGSITANTILQCTNAMQGGPQSLAPAVARSFVPLTVFQLATQVISADVRRTILKGNEALSDTRNNLFALRFTADGRIVTGGMAPVSQWMAEPRLLRSLARRMERIFPQLYEVKFDFIWSGGAALTPDFLPRLFEVGKNWFAPLGCNGRGIAMTTSLGQRLASYVVDRDPEVLPLPITSAAPIKAHTFARYVPQLLLPVGILQDAMRR